MASQLVVEAPVVISRANSAATSAAIAEGRRRARHGEPKSILMEDCKMITPAMCLTPV